MSPISAALLKEQASVHSFEKLNKEEVQYIPKEHWMDIGFEQQPNFWDGTMLMAEILRVTGGNFRLLDEIVTSDMTNYGH